MELAVRFAGNYYVVVGHVGRQDTAAGPDAAAEWADDVRPVVPSVVVVPPEIVAARPAPSWERLDESCVPEVAVGPAATAAVSAVLPRDVAPLRLPTRRHPAS